MSEIKVLTKKKMWTGLVVLLTGTGAVSGADELDDLNRLKQTICCQLTADTIERRVLTEECVPTEQQLDCMLQDIRSAASLSTQVLEEFKHRNRTQTSRFWSALGAVWQGICYRREISKSVAACSGVVRAGNALKNEERALLDGLGQGLKSRALWLEQWVANPVELAHTERAWTNLQHSIEDGID